MVHVERHRCELRSSGTRVGCRPSRKRLQWATMSEGRTEDPRARPFEPGCASSSRRPGPGTACPANGTLSERWGVARMTVRGATDALVAEGLVERRHGSGTYVLPRRSCASSASRRSPRTCVTAGLVPAAVSSISSVFAADALRSPSACGSSSAKPVIRFTRLRLGSGECRWRSRRPGSPSALVPGLAARATSTARCTSCWHADTGIGTGLGTRDDRAGAAPTRPDVAACSRSRRARRACACSMTDADTRGRVIMVADCVYRGDRYQLSADIAGAASRRRASGGPGARAPMATADAAETTGLMHILAVDGGQSAIRLRHSSSDRRWSRCAVSPGSNGRHRWTRVACRHRRQGVRWGAGSAV